MIITTSRLAAMIQLASDQYEKFVKDGKIDQTKGTFPKYAAIMLTTVLNVEARDRGEKPIFKMDKF